MQWICCNNCDTQVSSPIANHVQLRAWILCRDCTSSELLLKSLSELRRAIIDAAVDADWCHPGLGEAIHAAEKLLPKHLH